MAHVYKKNIIAIWTQVDLSLDRLHKIRSDIIILQQQLSSIVGDASQDMLQPRAYCDLLLGSMSKFLAFVEQYPHVHGLEIYEKLLEIIYRNEKKQVSYYSHETTHGSKPSQSLEDIQKTLHQIISRFPRATE
jgi:hypothetical protein